MVAKIWASKLGVGGGRPPPLDPHLDQLKKNEISITGQVFPGMGARGEDEVFLRFMPSKLCK